MKREEFLDFIKHSELTPVTFLMELDEVIKMYPFFSSAHIMLSRALNQSRDIRFPEVLKNASLYSGDRKVLYNLLYSGNQKLPDKEIEKTTSNPILEREVDRLHQEVLREERIDAKPVDIVSQILNYPEIILSEAEKKKEEKRDELIEKQDQAKEIVEIGSLELAKNLSGKHSFYDWLNQIKSVDKIKEQIDVIESKIEKEVIQKEHLIERFIQTEPRISKPIKTEFFSPVIMAKKSVEDNDDIVSETLAKIYADQGNLEKANRIYRKLSLLYPDKSGYFAALIQKLENPDLI